MATRKSKSKSISTNDDIAKRCLEAIQTFPGTDVELATRLGYCESYITHCRAASSKSGKLSRSLVCAFMLDKGITPGFLTGGPGPAWLPTVRPARIERGSRETVPAGFKTRVEKMEGRMEEMTARLDELLGYMQELSKAPYATADADLTFQAQRPTPPQAAPTAPAQMVSSGGYYHHNG